MSQQTTREVVFKWGIEVDPKYKAALDGVAKAAQATQDKMSAQRTKSAKEQQKAITDLAKWEIDVESRAAKSLERIRSDSHRMEADSLAKRQAAQQRYHAASLASSQQLLSASKLALEGTVSLARGLVLLGVAQEDDLKKAIQMLARFEALAAVLRGSVPIVQSLAQAYKALGAAQAAAAAVGGVRGVGGSAAGGLAGGAAGGLAGGAAAGVGAIGGLAAAGTAAVVGTLYAFSPLWREGLNELLGITNAAADAQAQITKKLEKQAAAIRDVEANAATSAGQRTARFNMMHEGAGLAGNRGSLETLARGDLLRARGAVSSAADAGGPTGLAVQTAANAQLLQALEQSKTVEREKLEIIKEQGRATLDRIRAEREGLQSQKAGLLALADAERGRLQTAAEHFEGLDPLQRQQLLDAAKAARAGQILDPGQRSLLRGSGITDLQDVAAKQTYAAAGELGFKDLAAPQEQAIANANRQAAALSLSIASKQHIEVTLNQDNAEAAKELTAKIIVLLQEQRRAIVDELDLKLRRERLATQQQNLQRGIGAGG